jgi:hypothetical protein
MKMNIDNPTKKDLIIAIETFKPKKVVVKTKFNPFAEYEVFKAEFDEITRNRVILKSSKNEISKKRKTVVNQLYSFLKFSLKNDYPLYAYIKDIPATYKVSKMYVSDEKIILSV